MTHYRIHGNLTSKEAVPWFKQEVATSERKYMGSVQKYSFKDTWWTKCGTVISFCLSTSGLLRQYFSAHTLYSSSSNVALSEEQKSMSKKPSKSNALSESRCNEYKSAIIQCSWVDRIEGQKSIHAADVPTGYEYSATVISVQKRPVNFSFYKYFEMVNSGTEYVLN